MAKTDGARYRKVYSQFWRDREVVGMREAERLVALYCMTGPQSNRIGLFAFSLALASEDFGCSVETFRERLRNVCRTLNWGYDETARVLHIPSWWKWNPPQNENIMTGNLKDLVDLPQTYLLERFADNTQHLEETFAKRLRNACETFLEGSPTQEQDKQQDKEQEQNQYKQQKQEQDFATSLAASERFDQFWSRYPERNGKKLHKQSARGKFLNLDDEEQEAAITAAANYARSSSALDGFAKDPHRFLEAGFWRDWLTPEVEHQIQDKRTQRAVNAIDQATAILMGANHDRE